MGLNRPLKHQVICHVTIFPKVVNYRPIGAGLRKEIEQTTFFLFILNTSNTSRLEWLSIALQENIMRESMILNAQI